MPGPGWYWIGEEEKREVLDVMESGHLVRYGKLDDPGFKQKTRLFEKEFAEYNGARHALATASGATALVAAMKAMGLRPGDEVIVPGYGFVATYSAAVFLGVVPVLAEIGDDLNLDPEDIERRLTPKTKAIVPIHMLGNPCNMAAIMAVADKHGLPVLEDVCQATGGTYHGSKLGTIGLAGVFSFNAFKVITAGDGGMIVTDSAELHERAFSMHDQGYHPFEGAKQPAVRNELGLKLCMTELTAAVGRAQLRKLDQILSTLRRKKAKLKEAIGPIPGARFRTLNDPEGECATLCTVLFDRADVAARVASLLETRTVDNTGWHVYDRMDHFMRYLKEQGRPAGQGTLPRTDDILGRSINLSVGVVDGGLGAAFGININSTDAEIERAAEQFRNACARTANVA
ncbi:MAG: DegT/DnrJ/EryC1/StrS family aminotransferase [Pirellulales bacterium]|nr:DegT/DnrJ/EryC1/StrS family aminotransferase [Pirellulales bacterium]